jgi:hypothetical protein
VDSWFFLPFPRSVVSVGCGSGRDEEPSGEEAVLRQIQIRLAMLSFEKISSACQDKFAAGANRRFKFQKRSQLFIRMHDETLSVVAMVRIFDERGNVIETRKHTDDFKEL